MSKLPDTKGYACISANKIIVPECPFCGRTHIHGLDKEFLIIGVTPRLSHCHRGEYAIRYAGTITIRECAEMLGSSIDDFEHKDIFTVSDIADMLDIPRSKVYSWIRTGKIKVVKIGGRLFIPEPEAVKFVNEYLKTANAFTTYQLAKFLEVSPSTVWNWVKQGILKAERVGNKYYIPKEEVIEMLREVWGDVHIL